MEEKCAILDCGGQYTKVIDRKVRELGVKSEIFPITVSRERLSGFGGVILSGGPASVWTKDAPICNDELFGIGIPILGICYGMQLINEYFGGRVAPRLKTEFGQTEIAIDNTSPLFDTLSQKETVLMSHGDAIEVLAPGFIQIAGADGAIAAIYNEEKRIAAVQFHPEVELTEHGLVMLENFLRKICAFRDTYALEDRIESSIAAIRQTVGDGKVVVLVSGGVDSAVSAALLVKALPPERVYAIHIDHGLMRKNESDLICENLKKQGFVHLLRVNAEEQFFRNAAEIGDGVIKGPLSKETDPEIKRQIIGRIFIDVTREASEMLGLDFDDIFLAQGTLRPDLIESGNPDVSSYANRIKTHHNDVDIIRKAREAGRVIETNWDWHKDEVRQVARLLGLDEEIAARQPFPGPGLGVRLICNNGKETVDGALDAQFKAYQKKHPFFGAIAPIRSVGVQGDNRSYRHLALLWGKGADFDIEQTFALAKSIPNNLDFINRCAYILDRERPRGEFESGRLYIERHTADLLREADHIVTKNIMNKAISQCFAVLVPLYEKAAGEQGAKYSVAVRAVVTSDFMTARPAVPGRDFPLDSLKNAVNEIKALSREIDLVMYDLTGKPPATVEWE